MTDTRDAFEAWFANGLAGLNLSISDNEFTLMSAQTSWIAWQAATKAERERCALVCELLQETALATQTGPADDLSNVMVRQIAYLGSGECAEAIRQGGDA